MLTIDGSFGEGGGQILRTSLALSLVTGSSVCLHGIRARRSRPGLLAQHLAAVRAAMEIGSADATGDALHSRELTFRPKRVSAGAYRFAVGTAGSSTLVFQTVLPALLRAEGPSELELEGGTHNPHAPPFEFLAKAFLPLVERMGGRTDVELVRPGFFPAGGGLWRATVHPPGGGELRPLELHERGSPRSSGGVALVSALPASIGEREVAEVVRRTGWPRGALRVVDVPAPRGPGNVVLLEVESERVTEVFAGFGRKGLRAERVAADVARAALDYLDRDVAVGPHLADQLLLPLALAGGGGFTTTAPLSGHVTTGIDVIRRFLDVEIDVDLPGDGSARVTVGRG